MRGTDTAERGQSVGDLLRGWRAAKGMSQLALALDAGFSPRHVSFIETGRTQPSRQAVLALAEALDVPLRERNRLLESAGFARVYRETPLGASEMRHLRGMLQFIIDRHEPYGAVVLDRYSNILMGNRPWSRLLSAIVDASVLERHGNLLRMIFQPLGARRVVVNWDEVARYLLGRAEREMADDAEGASLMAELRALAGPLAPRAAPVGPADPLLPVHVRLGDVELRLFSTIMTLGTPQDVTLQEMRIETFFPADDASGEVWSRLA